MDHAGEWSQAGSVCRNGGAGLWWAATGREHWPTDAESLARIRASWAPSFGDRRQELVFIGMDMDEEWIRGLLGASLLTNAEMVLGLQVWAHFDDPFDPWMQVVGESAAD